MNKQKINIEKDDLIKLYITENKTVAEIAELLNIGTATVNRFLKLYEIKKDPVLRNKKIAETINNRTEGEKLEYSQKISQARIGKGLGNTPWNKDKVGLQEAWNKGIKMSEDFCKAVKVGLDNMSEEAKAQKSKNLSIALTGRTPANKGKQMSQTQKEKIRHTLLSLPEEVKQQIVQQQYATKIKNKTCSISKPENLYKDYLICVYGEEDIITQYSTDSRYPFACDFYIKSIDTFIELNLHWSHGGHLFNESNQEDINKLNIWKEKAETSDFYKNAIETWTIRDVKKMNCAKENNLNYICIYSEEDLYND